MCYFLRKRETFGVAASFINWKAYEFKCEQSRFSEAQFWATKILVELNRPEASGKIEKNLYFIEIAVMLYGSKDTLLESTEDVSEEALEVL